LEQEPVGTDAVDSWIQNDPMGLILAIMPWNFPYWQVFRFAAPALMAGNGFLLKHAPNTPGIAREIADLFRDVGAPPGLGIEVLVDNVGAGRLIDRPEVAAVTLTGSTQAGRAVASRAGAALKPAVLELGGSDPFVVFADADLAEAARTAARSRLQNAGQSCIAAKRFLIEASVADRFVELLVEAMRAVEMGDPRDPATGLGPLARRDLRTNLERQVNRSTLAGAAVALGGQVTAGRGFFYPPTVLTGCGPGMPVWDEETFGPVAAVGTFSTPDEALSAANAGSYGLGATVWTADPERARPFWTGVRAGVVFVNGMVRSDARLPFGGVGESGYGRELGRDGLLAFVQRRSVWVGPGLRERTATSPGR
jgi:succinate-semialdehyde dehydrogenase/glutarate-semialdehyde dehydrogenase